jgi:hypothetical protein
MPRHSHRCEHLSEVLNLQDACSHGSIASLGACEWSCGTVRSTKATTVKSQSCIPKKTRFLFIRGPSEGFVLYPVKSSTLFFSPPVPTSHWQATFVPLLVHLPPSAFTALKDLLFLPGRADRGRASRTECTEHARRWMIPVSAAATSRGTLEASLLEKAGTRGSQDCRHPIGPKSLKIRAGGAAISVGDFGLHSGAVVS